MVGYLSIIMNVFLLEFSSGAGARNALAKCCDNRMEILIDEVPRKSCLSDWVNHRVPTFYNL